MGRTASFEKDQVIAAARDLFWQQGYEGTAVPDLERATGLRRSSLYHAFGSKKGLFDVVVENYLNEKIRPLLAKITEDAAPASALHAYFEAVSNSVRTQESHPGCLLIAAANSPIGQDETTQKTITGYYGELLTAFSGGVQRLHPELDREAVQAQARTLVALNVSALVLARTNKDLALANLAAAQALLEP